MTGSERARTVAKQAGTYGGLVSGTALEAYDRVLNAGGSVFRHANPWELDHVMHGWWCLGLTAVTDRTVDHVSRYTADLVDAVDDRTGYDLGDAAERARSPTTQRYAVAAGAAVLTFTAFKEGIVDVPYYPGINDSAPELGDVAGNLAPLLRYTGAPDRLQGYYADLRERSVEDLRPADD